jgi:hypothetical protein
VHAHTFLYACSAPISLGGFRSSGNIQLAIWLGLRPVTVISYQLSVWAVV